MGREGGGEGEKEQAEGHLLEGETVSTLPNYFCVLSVLNASIKLGYRIDRTQPPKTLNQGVHALLLSQRFRPQPPYACSPAFSPLASTLSPLFSDCGSAAGAGAGAGCATGFPSANCMRNLPTLPTPSIGPSLASKSLASRTILSHVSTLYHNTNVNGNGTHLAFPPGVFTAASLITFPTCSR